MTLRVPLQTGKEGTVGLSETTKRRDSRREKKIKRGSCTSRKIDESKDDYGVLDICIFLYCLKDWIFNGC